MMILIIFRGSKKRLRSAVNIADLRYNQSMTSQGNPIQCPNCLWSWNFGPIIFTLELWPQHFGYCIYLSLIYPSFAAAFGSDLIAVALRNAVIIIVRIMVMRMIEQNHHHIFMMMMMMTREAAEARVHSMCFGYLDSGGDDEVFLFHHHRYHQHRHFHTRHHHVLLIATQ